MKKILLIILILSAPFLVYGQFTGSGTSSDPYSGGTLTGNQTWLLSNSPIYVSGDLHVGTSSSNGHLTIEAGVTVAFCATGADLIITGIGQLTADGTPGSQIRFSADNNKNGIYGESGERWGHISFQNMTKTNPQNYPSIINNCIIEYGQKSSGPYGNIESYGGGVFVAFTYLTISNSIIRNNYAGWGGGVFDSATYSPSIKNSIISNNTSGTTGGGMFFHSNTASVVENCIIEKNTSSGNGGAGGVFLGDHAGDVRFYNCVLASNISTLNYGNNVLFYYNNPTTRPKFYNTIIWGSNSPSVTYWNYSVSTTDFNYCALPSDATASYFNSCFNLNNSNTAPDGPNFVDPNNLNYLIKANSPCRDAGTSSGAPATDFLGNGRIYNYDIGAYEIQYSRWRTTPDDNLSWTDPFNWEQGLYPGSSGSNGDIVIPLLPGSSSAPNIGGTIYINSGNYMILEPGAMASFGNLTNLGTLLLKSDASNLSSLITDSYSGNDATVELYLTGGGTKTTYKWHYISSPVSSLAVSTFSPAYTLDLAQYVESRPTLSLREGWVAYDGYIYSTGGMGGPTFSSLTPGMGYDYYRSAANKFTFSGQLNTGDITVNLGFSGDATLNGFNLIGNPFSSGLNWDDLIGSLYYPFPSNTSQALYFTRDNAQCSYINGVGIPSDVNGIIPPMQGFFSKTYSTGNSITFPATSRIHDNIHSRYKGYGIIPLIRLALTDDTLSDETVIRFNDQAKAGLDINYDAMKMFLDDSISSIYSVLSGVKYAINGQPFPVQGSPLLIPIAINITTDTTLHTITATQLQGLDNYDVQLIDNVTGIVTNLKTNPSVLFTAQKGTVSNRFIVRVNKIVTGIENPVSSGQTFNIYPANGLVNILTLSDLWDGKTGSVRVLDLTGKTIFYLTNKEFDKNILLQIQSPVVKGIYMVELKSGALRYVGKVVIR